MKIEIGNYTISTKDEYNFVLELTRPKRDSPKGKGVGDMTVVIGYYGTLACAFNKLVNDSILNDEDGYTAKELLQGLNDVKQKIDDAYRKIKPRESL